MLEKFHTSCGATHKHRQYTGGQGVQGAAVTDAAGFENAPQLAYHVLAGPALGLVYDYDSVHSHTSGKLLFSGVAAKGFPPRGRVYKQQFIVLILPLRPA
jgi:hypothetical protein